jgi:uncharacterized damage-inducible protein DinB
LAAAKKSRAKTGSSRAASPASRGESPLALLFPDLESELAITRRVLERVPEGRDDWRPHHKSRSLGELATHIAQLPGFGIMMLTQDEFDGSKPRPQPSVADNADRLRMFDQVSAALRGQLEAMTWEHARSPWTLRIGDRIIFREPRAKLVRSAYVTHAAHHRAQLGVYLRLLDMSVPATYGASADEQPVPVPPR